MKKIALAIPTLLTIFYVGSGCSSSTPETNTDPGAAALSPEATIAELKAKNKPEDIALGKTIELNSCGKCHVHYPPELHTVKEWDALLPRMTIRAGLDATNAEKLRAYLLVNSKQ